MNIKLDHINLTVGNLEESVKWYEKIFGFKLVEHGISRESKRWAIVAHNDSMICMTEYRGRESAAKHDQEAFHQFYHFGIRVSDLESWQDKVITHNLKLYYGGVNEYSHSKSWYVQDPNGHEIEVSFSSGKPLQFPPISKGELL